MFPNNKKPFRLLLPDDHNKGPKPFPGMPPAEQERLVKFFRALLHMLGGHIEIPSEVIDERGLYAFSETPRGLSGTLVTKTPVGLVANPNPAPSLLAVQFFDATKTAPAQVVVEVPTATIAALLPVTPETKLKGAILPTPGGIRMCIFVDSGAAADPATKPAETNKD